MLTSLTNANRQVAAVIPKGKVIFNDLNVCRGHYSRAGQAAIRPGSAGPASRSRPVTAAHPFQDTRNQGHFA